MIVSDNFKSTNICVFIFFLDINLKIYTKEKVDYYSSILMHSTVNLLEFVPGISPRWKIVEIIRNNETEFHEHEEIEKRKF